MDASEIECQNTKLGRPASAHSITCILLQIEGISAENLLYRQEYITYGGTVPFLRTVAVWPRTITNAVAAPLA